MATVYVNGTVYTMRHEGDQCTAFVVDDGKFMYCGTDEGARAFGEGCQLVDLKGKTVIPGMIDTHQHLFAYARDLLKLNLKGAGSKKRAAGNDPGKSSAHTRGRVDPWNRI